MRVTFSEYQIDILDEPAISLDSTDSLFTYDKIYFDRTAHSPTSKYGIRVSKDGQYISSALICETGGSTGVYDNSFIIAGKVLLICCCNSVYSFKLPELRLSWKKKFDSATCFAIYPFKDDFIIHGELAISRIDPDGNVKWNFFGKDIFVTQDGTNAIILTEDRIEVTDWTDNKYILNDNGQPISCPL
jgi:hypothetical protein